MKLKHSSLFLSLCFFFVAQMSWAGRAPLLNVAADPYASAFVVDADTGEILFAKNEDTPVYPASTLKLMVLLVILDQLEQGSLQLDEMVQVTVEAYKMGGSQVYLDPKEQFPLEDLLYALMIQSANDAAVALATHVAGTTEAFVALMNQKAEELGMKNTKFYSVHGLPPAQGQKVDVTTARDFGTLCRHLSKRQEVFKYTGTQERDFRGGEFIMRTHNHLLKKVAGCDGFKTGYFTKAGFSIAATAKKGNVRIIAIVMGCKSSKVRDTTAIELLAKGFAKVPARAALPIDVTQAQLTTPVTSVAEETQIAVIQSQEELPPSPSSSSADSGWGTFLTGLGLGFFLYATLDFLVLRKRSKSEWRNKRF